MQRDRLFVEELINVAERARELTTATEQLGSLVKALRCVLDEMA